MAKSRRPLGRLRRSARNETDPCVLLQDEFSRKYLGDDFEFDFLKSGENEPGCRTSDAQQIVREREQDARADVGHNEIGGLIAQTTGGSHGEPHGEPAMELV